MKRIGRYLAILLSVCMICAACGTVDHEKKSSTEAPDADRSTTELMTKEPTTEEPTTEEPTTEAPEPVDIHTQETQVAGEGIVQAFETGKTLLADLDGDGNAEKITVKVDPEKGYDESMSMQIDGVYCDEEEFNRITGYMEGPERREFYLINLDTSDQWLEIAFFEYGPSNDPQTTFLRYREGEIIRIGRVSTGPPDVEYVDYNGMIIPGDGTVSGRARYDIVQTSFVTKTWKLKNGAEFDATLAEVIPEYYQFRLRSESEYRMYLTQDTTFFTEMSDNPSNLITLPTDTVVDIARYYPEGGWLQVIYEQGTKTVWLKLDENETLQPINVHRWSLGQYIAGLGNAD